MATTAALPSLRIRHTRRRMTLHELASRPAAQAHASELAPSSTSSSSVAALPFRVGHGFDLHRLETGVGKLVLAGVEIPHTKGCAAHSDGDVLAHTVTDAILGALCLPDIGQLFPDNDPKWHKQVRVCVEALVS